MMHDAPPLATAVPPGERPVSRDLRVAQRMRACGLIVLVALPFLLFWPSTDTLLARWQDSVQRTYTHGMLIVAFSFWMIWRARARWMDHSTQTFIPGAVAVVMLGLAWLISYRAGLQIVHQALLPLIAFAAILACCGPRLARAMTLPIGYLYFAIPVWDAINPILQSISVFAVRALLRIAGIPAYFQGDTFHIPAGSFEIASGCSGLHFFVVAVAIAVLYGEINEDRWKTRVHLVVLAGVLAMLTNWVRVFVIVLAGHLTDMQHYLVSGEHYSFGWFVFAAVMIGYFLIVRRWEAPAKRVPAEPPEGRIVALPRVGFALAVVAMLPAVIWNLLGHSAQSAAAHQLPSDISGWQSSPASLAQWQPVFKGSDAEQSHIYRSGDGTVEGYAATYLHQRQGKEVIGYENSILGSGWAGSGRRRPAARGWTELEATDARGEQWLVWYAYRLDERWYSKPIELQVAYGLSSLVSAPLTSVVAVRTRCADDCEAARDSLDRFTAGAWR